MDGRLLLCLLALALSGCGSDAAPDRPAPRTDAPPVLGRPAEDEDAAESLGFPAFATKNTTRVGGADPVAGAAGVARAVYPGGSRAGRPDAVVVVDADDWRTAISAAQLAAAPLRLPVLFARDGELPAASRDALEALEPAGAEQAGKAQVVAVGGEVPEPSGVRVRRLRGADPAALARAIDRLAAGAAGRPSPAVIVAPSEAPGVAMPAAALAARSGAPVLWTDGRRLPAATRQAIRERSKPRIYVLGPASVISAGVASELEHLGTVRRIGVEDPVRNAVAVARYGDGRFGWGVTDPGHGLVFASAERPADAAAGALLSSTGKHGPLLLVKDAAALPGAVESFLLDIQPGYDEDPVRGVYNHGWLLGGEDAISVRVQARIDALLEIQPVNTGS